jgi:hypothetical protein
MGFKIDLSTAGFAPNGLEAEIYCNRQSDSYEKAGANAPRLSQHCAVNDIQSPISWA